jgi:Do/DeqQ family serine protease
MRVSHKVLSISALLASITAVILLLTVLGAPNRTAAAPQQTAPPAHSTVLPQQSYADVVDRVAPAVVTIRAAKRVRAPQQFPFSDDPFFRQFFGDRFGNSPRQNRPQLERALGSGVIVSPDGHILTNHHVVDGADQISVELNDRRTLEAKLVGSDAPSDLAVLKIEAHNLPVLTLGDSDRVRVGDVCLAVGNPLGIGETVTAGIISAKGRDTGPGNGSFQDFLQTDAAINQGNSGGALVDTHGQLIGINSQILSPSGGNIGIGFAIPSNMARSVMEQLNKGGKVHRGKLGVGIQDVTYELSKSMDLKDVRGVMVNSVEGGGPAEKAGLKQGDIITAINGKPVDDSNALRNQVAAMAPGSDVAVTVTRDGKPQTMHAKLVELPEDREAAAEGGRESGGAKGQLGITIQPVTAQIASELGLRGGARGMVVTEVDPGGPAAEAGIQPDDVILEANHQPVKSSEDLRSALQRSGNRPALLLISREGRTVFVAVQPK